MMRSGIEPRKDNQAKIFASVTNNKSTKILLKYQKGKSFNNT